METTKTAKEKSLEQENRIAKLFKGSRTPRSGGGPFIAGDVLSDDWLVECKTTVNPTLSYSIQKSIIDKANHERAEMHKSYLALAFTLGETYEDYFVLDSKTMKSLLEKDFSLKSLQESLSSRLSQITIKMQEIGNVAEDRGMKVSVLESALFQAHLSELKYFLEELSKIQ